MSSRTIDRAIRVVAALLIAVQALPGYGPLQNRAVRIASRAKLGGSSGFREFVGGSQTVKQLDWSYLALVNGQGDEVEVGPAFIGLSFDLLSQVENRYFWAFASSTVEGAKSWVLLAISQDAGRSWKIVKLSDVLERAGRISGQRIHVQEISRADFSTRTEGLIEIVLEESGKRILLITEDGGFHWNIKTGLP